MFQVVCALTERDAGGAFRQGRKTLFGIFVCCLATSFRQLKK